MKSRTVRNPDLALEVEALNEQVRLLAINLAAYLAREKDAANRFAAFEPDFHRLVSGLISLVTEVSGIIEASHQAPADTSLSETAGRQAMEQQLSSLRTLCRGIEKRLTGEKSFPTA